MRAWASWALKTLPLIGIWLGLMTLIATERFSWLGFAVFVSPTVGFVVVAVLRLFEPSSSYIPSTRARRH